MGPHICMYEAGWDNVVVGTWRKSLSAQEKKYFVRATRLQVTPSHLEIVAADDENESIFYRAWRIIS